MAQRQFRPDDTSTWQEQFGYGTAGVVNINSNTNYDGTFNGAYSPGYASVNSGGGTASATTLTVTDASYAWRIQPYDPILIIQNQFGSYGAWELNVSLSTFPNSSSATVNLKYPLMNNYTTGAQVIRLVPWFMFNVNGSSILTPPASWNGTWGGITAIMSSYQINIASGAYIDAGGYGYRGGQADNGSNGHQGWAGESYDHSWNTNSSQGQVSGAGGGGHGGSQGGNGSGGGGGGGAYSVSGSSGGGWGSGSGGSGGSTYGVANLTSIYFGAGGGGNGMDTGLVQINGLPGGGIVMLFAPQIIIGTTQSKGADSYNSAYASGGAGAGGAILIKCNTLSATNLYTNGGAQSPAGTNPGTPSNWNAYGGAGGAGRIHVDYGTSYSVTNTSGVDYTQSSFYNIPPKQPSGILLALF